MKKYTVFVLLFYVAIISCKMDDTYDNLPEETVENDSFIDAHPFDIQYDKDRGWLYLFESTGEITIYDIAHNTVKTKISTEATIGYCDFGEYNGVKELYVPRTDGWIFIYNASTLKLIDQISIGASISSVVHNNGILFASAVTRTLKTCNRSTKQVTTNDGDFELTRLIKVPGTNTDLLELTLNITPPDQNYYTFDEEGTFVSSKDDIYHGGGYELQANIFEFFPTGNKYVTSAIGSLYSKNMEYETSLPRGNLWFTTFELDDSARFIYAGTDQKSIAVYDANTYQITRKITTKGYPFRIFYNGGALLCVSSSNHFSNGLDHNAPPSNLLIEHLK
jgi:hypothetical protein